MPSPLVIAVGVGAVAAGATGLVVAPRRRLADKVRPYRAVVGDRAATVTPSEGAAWTPTRGAGGPRVRRHLDSPRSRARLATQLRAAGFVDASVEQFRVRQFGTAGAMAAAGVVLGALVLHSAAMTLLLVGCGAAVGFTRAPSQLAQRVEARQRRMRLELVTVDQVLAIHVRAGAGPVQAISRIVDRGHGEVVDELRAILTSIRSGRAEAEAFRHAASITAEPHAARTYRLFALAAEQGADLGTALRALSDDLRDVRRDELRREATRRRAAMLVPTIAVLAPLMLLFVIAPLPSIVLGGR
jgi:tight adherence protein C